MYKISCMRNLTLQIFWHVLSSNTAILTQTNGDLAWQPVFCSDQ